MKVPTNLINKWASLKERGDSTEVARILGLDQASASRIIDGKQKTSVKNIRKVIRFFNKRESDIKEIQNA